MSKPLWPKYEILFLIIIWLNVNHELITTMPWQPTAELQSRVFFTSNLVSVCVDVCSCVGVCVTHSASTAYERTTTIIANSLRFRSFRRLHTIIYAIVAPLYEKLCMMASYICLLLFLFARTRWADLVLILQCVFYIIAYSGTICILNKCIQNANSNDDDNNNNNMIIIIIIFVYLCIERSAIQNPCTQLRTTFEVIRILLSFIRLIIMYTGGWFHCIPHITTSTKERAFDSLWLMASVSPMWCANIYVLYAGVVDCHKWPILQAVWHLICVKHHTRKREKLHETVRPMVPIDHICIYMHANDIINFLLEI